MKTCKICGKPSILLSKDGLCKKCYAENEARKKQRDYADRIRDEMKKKDPSYAKFCDDLEYQNKLLAEVNAARERFKVDKDIQAAIAVYERVLLHSTPPLKSNAHTMFLSNLYIQAEEYDKAWGYLNHLLITNPSLTYDIRKDQCRILKKEKKYVDAMQMLSLSYLAESKWNNTFKIDAFSKEATPIANKLGWNSENIKQIATCIQYHVGKKDYNEASLIADLKKIITWLNESTH